MMVQDSKVDQLNDLQEDLFDIMEDGGIDDKMLKRLTNTILKDLGCTEVSLWTINRNNKWVDGTPRTEDDKYLSTSLICRSKKSGCEYEFPKKQECTHSLKQKCLFAEVVNNVSTKEPFKYFSSKEAIEGGFTSRDFIEKVGIKHIYVIPITEKDKNDSSKEAIAIIELSFCVTTPLSEKKMYNDAKKIHSVCYLALSNYRGLQKQRLISRLIESQSRLIESQSEIAASKDEFLCEEIIKIIHEFLPCQGASFFLKHPFQKNYCLKASTGLYYTSSNSKIDKSKYGNVRYKKGEGLTGMVGENGKIFISDNLAKDKERPHISKTYEIVQGEKDDPVSLPLSRVKTGMFIPINSNKEANDVIGIIRLVNKKNKCNPDYVDFFNDVDADIMDFASKYLSAVFESRLNAEKLCSFEKRMSHEVFKPTGSINFYIDQLIDDLLENKIDDDGMIEQLKRIKTQVDRQDHILDVVEKLYGNGFDTDGEYMDGADLYNIICKSWEEMEPVANRYNIQKYVIENKIPEDRYILRVNTNAFIMVFSNLFENAIKYNDETEDNILVRVTAMPSEGDLHVFISDYGIGIRNSDLELVFNEGFRGGNVKDDDGSGIGLPTVKRILEEFKGAIKITRAKKPTIFRIVLPKEIVHYNYRK